MDSPEETFCNTSLNLSNCSGQHDEEGFVPFGLTPEAFAVPVTFVVIFFVGVTGNVLLTLNFARHKKLSTPHNALVINLAAGDFLMLTIGLPFNSVWYTVPEWPFGDLLCRLTRFAETLATAVTIATLTVLSIERYLIVTGRRRNNPLSTVSMVVITFIWVVSFLLSLPDLLSAKVVTLYMNSTTTTAAAATPNATIQGVDSAEICFDYDPEWGSLYPRVIVMSKFCLLFLIPLLVIAPCYVALAFHLIYRMFGSQGTPTSRTPLRPSSAHSTPLRQDTEEASSPGPKAKNVNNGLFHHQKPGSSARQDAVNSTAGKQLNQGTNGSSKHTPTRKRRRLAATVLGLVLTFVLCWLPRHTYLLWFRFDPTLYNTFWHVFKIFGFCLMFSNSAVNPFVFYVLDLRFRAFVNAVVLCRLRRSSDDAGKETGDGKADTAAVEVSMMEDKKNYIVLEELPTDSDRVEAV